MAIKHAKPARVPMNTNRHRPVVHHATLTCYVDAADWVEMFLHGRKRPMSPAAQAEFASQRQGIRIVHARCRFLNDRRKRYGHGWVQDGDLIYEAVIVGEGPQGNMPRKPRRNWFAHDRQAFEKYHGVSNATRYTIDQYFALLKEHGHYGPFAPDLRRGIPKGRKAFARKALAAARAPWLN